MIQFVLTLILLHCISVCYSSLKERKVSWHATRKFLLWKDILAVVGASEAINVMKLGERHGRTDRLRPWLKTYIIHGLLMNHWNCLDRWLFQKISKCHFLWAIQSSIQMGYLIWIYTFSKKKYLKRYGCLRPFGILGGATNPLSNQIALPCGKVMLKVSE